MNPLGLLIVVVASMSSVGYASFRVADRPDRDIVESIVEIETKYIGLDENSGDKLLEPSETLAWLRRLELLLNDLRTLDGRLEIRARVVEKLIEYGRDPDDDSCDETDIYEQAILSGMMDEARNIVAYLKFHARIRIAHCAAVDLGKAKGSLTLDTWEELQQLMSYLYGEAPPPEGHDVPTPMTVAKGIVEYMQTKKALPSTGVPMGVFRERFIATVWPLCMNFNQALGPAVSVFVHYTKSDLGNRMSAKDITLLNYYEVCSIAQAYWAQAYKVFSLLLPLPEPKTQASVIKKEPSSVGWKWDGFKWIRVEK